MKKNIIKKNEEYAKKYSNTSIKYDKSFQILKLILDELKERHKLNLNEILSLVEEKPISKEILIPVSVFEEKELSALEAVCKYLKEELELNYSKIALLLNRNSRTIWATYNNAIKKAKERLIVKEAEFVIPVSVFTDRRFSVLESIASYLKERYSLRYSKIAVLLNRDERNIWTICNKATKKKNE